MICHGYTESGEFGIHSVPLPWTSSTSGPPPLSTPAPRLFMVTNLLQSSSKISTRERFPHSVTQSDWSPDAGEKCTSSPQNPLPHLPAPTTATKPPLGPRLSPGAGLAEAKAELCWARFSAHHVRGYSLPPGEQRPPHLFPPAPPMEPGAHSRSLQGGSERGPGKLAGWRVGGLAGQGLGMEGGREGGRGRQGKRSARKLSLGG